MVTLNIRVEKVMSNVPSPVVASKPLVNMLPWMEEISDCHVCKQVTNENQKRENQSSPRIGFITIKLQMISTMKLDIWIILSGICIHI